MEQNKTPRFSKAVHTLMTSAINTAIDFGDSHVELHHLLLAMTSTIDSDAFLALADHDIIEAKLKPLIEMTMQVDLDKASSFYGSAKWSDTSMQVLDLSHTIATENGQSYTRTSALLIGLMRIESEVIDSIFKHFAVHRKDIIKRAEYYLTNDITPEAFDFGVETVIWPRGCFASLLSFLGLGKDSNDENE